jgi:murein L,D-transpeptidase YcbB/YkuD
MFRIGVSRAFRAAFYAAALAMLAITGASADQGREASLATLRLAPPGDMLVAGQMLDKQALRTFYSRRRDMLAWDESRQGLGDRASVVFTILSNADAEGLDPADYHVREIAELANAGNDTQRLNRDLLLTDGLIRYATDVAGGKLTSHQTDERFVDRQSQGLPDYLASASSLDAGALKSFLDGLPPASPEYAALKRMLSQLRLLNESGGWEALPDGQTIRPGEHDPAVPALRQRLIEEWRIPATTIVRKGREDLYDPLLAAAVASFQAQHGIKPDGVIGKDTRAALDLPVEDRVRQIVVNMERARWMPDIPLEGRSIVVNLASYSLNVYQDGNPVLTMPVVVGSPENQTPMIASNITTVVLNPNWTLPPNVIKEMLPRIHEDSDYLATKGIAREAMEDGRIRLVQPPGPTNPLGHYKFVMPNDQDIYLHDSPDVAKFRYALRAYSHGCIRLGNPAALAALLLDDRVDSLPDGLDALVQKGETRHIALSKPVPVALVYRTAWLDRDGRLVMGQDSYGRDARMWRALQKARATPRKVAERNAFSG